MAPAERRAPVLRVWLRDEPVADLTDRGGAGVDVRYRAEALDATR